MEVERVVNRPDRGFPRRDGEKYMVDGCGQGDRVVAGGNLIDEDA